MIIKIMMILIMQMMKTMILIMKMMKTKILIMKMMKTMIMTMIPGDKRKDHDGHGVGLRYEEDHNKHHS